MVRRVPDKLLSDAEATDEVSQLHLHTHTCICIHVCVCVGERAGIYTYL